TGTRVTDAGLKIVSGFHKLNRLDVSNCDITDKGLRHLSRLASLLSLNLSGTNVTDAGIEHLSGLNLETLGLQNTATSDACLKYLKGMRFLSYLGAGRTRITPEGFAKIVGLPSAIVDVNSFDVRYSRPQ
ncbi:MAG TPA: hypothetical protein PK867_28250, partial [Pirellulales bacterium]|nr:hypothetical protein [Pirellulales bacterium]